MLLSGGCFALALTLFDKAIRLLPPGLEQQEKVLGINQSYEDKWISGVYRITATEHSLDPHLSNSMLSFTLVIDVSPGATYTPLHAPPPMSRRRDNFSPQQLQPCPTLSSKGRSTVSVGKFSSWQFRGDPNILPSYIAHEVLQLYRLKSRSNKRRCANLWCGGKST